MTETNLISLRGLELIITYRGSSEERRDNLRGVLRHLHRTYSDYQVWLIEADAAPTFIWNEFGDPKIRHVFLHETGPFPKARLVNLGALMTKSPIICMHDADMIANPVYFRGALNALMDEDKSDVLCPFTRVLNVSGDPRKSFIESGDFDRLAPVLDGELPADINLLYDNTPGAINLFRRAEFIRVGGLDPAFIGWGGEDDDLLIRAGRLGVRWHSFTGAHAALFHLNHDSASRNQSLDEEDIAKNRQRAFRTNEIPIDELEARAAELSKYFG
ncbi:Galactosyltransferase [Caballeronia catudaia]|uniref:Galactosyltransferase n=1 Tax=Caballeronia catudaia TaxID=1777136 RepID=A0A158BPX7_9BURK|nr:glycosyltransferase family 2 protein [Caballeronia catudaia]SAK72040.1 Galactosyltransferase [Caballeronia catudaia]